MGFLRHEKLFCAICKNTIEYKQKAKLEWNIDGYLCGDCWVNEMQKQYVLKEEIKEQENPKKVKSKNPTRSVKFQYYFNLFVLGLGIFTIILNLISGNLVFLFIGIIVVVIIISQYPKKKRELDQISENEYRVSEHEDSPLSVLKMRLAKGEITKEEFDKIKDDLKD